MMSESLAPLGSAAGAGSGLFRSTGGAGKAWVKTGRPGVPQADKAGRHNTIAISFGRNIERYPLSEANEVSSARGLHPSQISSCLGTDRRRRGLMRRDVGPRGDLCGLHRRDLAIRMMQSCSLNPERRQKQRERDPRQPKPGSQDRRHKVTAQARRPAGSVPPQGR